MSRVAPAEPAGARVSVGAPAAGDGDVIARKPARDTASPHIAVTQPSSFDDNAIASFFAPREGEEGERGPLELSVCGARVIVESAPLGSGGTATVYPAFIVDDDRTRPVALKVVRVPDSSHVDRVVREIRALKAMEGISGACGLLDECEFDAVSFESARAIAFALPLCDGTLYDALHASADIPPLLPDWLEQVRDAVYELHYAGWVHRDIKPENVFLRQKRALLGDVGLARHVAAPARIGRHARCVHRGHEETGVFGSPGFIAPSDIDTSRQVREPATPAQYAEARAADMFAYLATVFECFSAPITFERWLKLYEPLNRAGLADARTCDIAGTLMRYRLLVWY